MEKHHPRPNPDADAIDRAVDEPVGRHVRGMQRLIQALRAESYPLDRSNIDYAVGDIDVEDGYGGYIPVRDLTDELPPGASYDNAEDIFHALQAILNKRRKAG
jgi:hypothetical protein